MSLCYTNNEHILNNSLLTSTVKLVSESLCIHVSTSCLKCINSDCTMVKAWRLWNTWYGKNNTLVLAYYGQDYIVNMVNVHDLKRSQILQYCYVTVANLGYNADPWIVNSVSFYEQFYLYSRSTHAWPTNSNFVTLQDELNERKVYIYKDILYGTYLERDIRVWREGELCHSKARVRYD